MPVTIFMLTHAFKFYPLTGFEVTHLTHNQLLSIQTLLLYIFLSCRGTWVVVDPQHVKDRQHIL